MFGWMVKMVPSFRFWKTVKKFLVGLGKGQKGSLGSDEGLGKGEKHFLEISLRFGNKAKRFFKPTCVFGEGQTGSPWLLLGFEKWQKCSLGFLASLRKCRV